VPDGSQVDTFPRQYARTQRLTLGEPRNVVVSPDGRRVVFARSLGGSDPVNCLWVLDLATGQERLVADPRSLLMAGNDSGLPAEERTRRERARERAGGVVAYATDTDVRVAAFALGGRLFTAGLISATSRELVVPGPVFDPRPDPTASRVAYVCGRTLRVAELDGTSREIGGPSLDDAESVDDDDVSWGSAEFVAAEEMGRTRGYWWSPDGTQLAVTRIDVSAVARWWIADPAHPDRTPTEVAYPAAGTANAFVALHVIGLDGTHSEVTWDRDAFPYLASVSWTTAGLHLGLQSRDQRLSRVVRYDPVLAITSTVYDDHDDAWVELVAGTPAFLADGRIVTAADREGARRLMVDGAAVTPPTMQLRSVIAASGRAVTFVANELAEPTEHHVHQWTDGMGLVQLSSGVGVHTAAVGGATVVLRSSLLDRPGTVTQVRGGPFISSHAEVPLVRPNVTLVRAGERSLATALLLPDGADRADRADLLPVLLDPYGGPHSQRVVASRSAYLSAQWFADQGFAVVITDGRGTPGRGSAWERAVRFDLATAVLEDQVDALHAVAADHPQLDLSRVAIRGWSFGGYLAALAVLRRPDVFHAAVAGAPVTEWRLYDTHYTERYLGDPSVDPSPYDRCSLLVDAERLERPLLLVHGLADDNVVAAHTLQLSSALLAAGKSHQVLPLSGVSHITPQEIVAENLLLLQLAFLRHALGLADEEAPDPR
jgi:dipeptidyl-peptidase 4